MFSHAVKLLNINGFDIKVDPSWLLIAALITWALSRQYFPNALPGQDVTTYLIMALITMLCFFASLVLHELAHSVVARRFGVPIKNITLFLFGGVAELEAEPQSARVEFWVAVAGPALSLCLGFGLFAQGGLRLPLSLFDLPTRVSESEQRLFDVSYRIIGETVSLFKDQLARTQFDQAHTRTHHLGNVHVAGAINAFDELRPIARAALRDGSRSSFARGRANRGGGLA